MAASRNETLPSDEHVTDTVIVDPLAALGVNTQPVAASDAATFEKSPAAIPLTLSVNASVYVKVLVVCGLDGAVHEADGGVVSRKSMVKDCVTAAADAYKIPPFVPPPWDA